MEVEYKCIIVNKNLSFFESNFIYYFAYCYLYEICDGWHQIQVFILHNFCGEYYNYVAFLQGGTFSSPR